MIKFPIHKAGLMLLHDPHKTVYLDAEEYVKGTEEDWVNEEEMNKALQEDSIWELTWYERTPIGSQTVYASSLEAIIDHVNNNRYDRQT